MQYKGPTTHKHLLKSKSDNKLEAIVSALEVYCGASNNNQLQSNKI